VEQTSALFATFTLFIPPLAFVPEQVQTSYALNYGLFDPQNRLVYQAALPATVDGSFTGWYIGRIFTSRDLLEAEHSYAARNAARAVLNDVFAHAAAIAAALESIRVEASASDESADASAGAKSPAPESAKAPAAKPWWQSQ
jgi:hypothetical protein